MATTPQGDDRGTRQAVMASLARNVARQQMAQASARTKPRKLVATYALNAAPRSVTGMVTR